MKAIFFVTLLLVAANSVFCPNNCNDCDPNGSICFACAEGFELSVTGSCVSATIISKCTLYGPTNQCFVCQPTFSLDNNGNCLKNGSPCLVNDASDDTLCMNCGFGTTLGKDGKCAGVINCAEQAGNGCKTCQTGFSLSGGRCVDNTGNCRTVGSNGICVTCNANFALVGYTCRPTNLTVYACYIFDGNNNCLTCKMGYNLFQGNCLIPSEIQQIQLNPASLNAILSQRSSAITTNTTVTTITTAATTSGSSDGFGGFGGFGDFGGFGGGDSGFGGSSGFGGQPTTTTTNTNTNTANSNFGSTSINSSFGGSSGSGGFDSSSSSSGGFGTSSNSTNGFGSTNSGGFGTSSSTSTSSSSSTGSSSLSGSSTTTSTPVNPAVNQKIENCAVADQTIVGKCITCIPGYTSNGMGCIYVSPLCASYDLKGNGSCLSCKWNLNLVNGNCIDVNCQTSANNVCTKCKDWFSLNANQVCTFTDPNCQVPLDTRCAQCIAGFFVTAAGRCQRLPANCIAADMQSFVCIQCASGFVFNANRLCITQPIPLPPNCKIADPRSPSTLCSVCNDGYTVSAAGICQLNIPNCQAYNLQTGVCVTCISGWALNNGVCVLVPATNPGSGSSSSSGGIIIINNSGSSSNSSGSTTVNTNTNTNNNVNINSNINTNTAGGSSGVANRDSNCINYSGAVCTACSSRYYFGPSNLCVPVNPLCKDYISNGSCSSCYPGYTISNGNCIVSIRSSDPFCKSYTPGGVCTACYTGYFLNQALGSCQPLNPLCRTSNLTDGTCLSCFPGYSLSQQGRCTVAFQDPNCQKFDNAKTNCLNCSANFFLAADGKCKQINPLCKTADQSTGACLSCYPGYVLQGITCAIGAAATIDVNCAQFNNSICVKCSNNYYLNAQGVCTQNNPLCRTSSNTGACLSCYPGYTIQGITCVISTSQTSNADPNCKSTDANGACTGCYSSYFLSAQATCIRLDPLCKNYTASMSQCGACYDGYTLTSNGKCLVSSEVPNTNNDPYCIKSKDAFCITCANGYYLAPSGNCTQTNPLCKTSDPTTGACTDCYSGYTLAPPTCIVAASVNIPYCQTVVGISCTFCISGYYVKDGGCALANVLCATYDPQNGTCWSCVPGYVFQNAGCILPALGIDQFCQLYDTNSFCSQCVPGYALVSYVCTQIDVNCRQFDSVRNVCKTCTGGKIPQGPLCV